MTTSAEEWFREVNVKGFCQLLYSNIT